MLFPVVNDPKTETVLNARMRYNAQGLGTLVLFLPTNLMVNDDQRQREDHGSRRKEETKTDSQPGTHPAQTASNARTLKICWQVDNPDLLNSLPILPRLTSKGTNTLPLRGVFGDSKEAKLLPHAEQPLSF